MPSGTGLTRFASLHRDRFFDVGIAEEHAVAMAAGMAAQGLVPVVALYSTFLQRAYDQIVHDVAIEKLHVVFCIDRAGIVGADGATHNGVLDIAFLRSIPGMTILCPSSFAELKVMMTRRSTTKTALSPFAIPRGGEGSWRGDTAAQPLAFIKENGAAEVTLVTHGIMINETLAAAEKLEERGVRTQVCKVNETVLHWTRRSKRRKTRSPACASWWRTQWITAASENGSRRAARTRPCASARATVSCRTAA